MMILIITDPTVTVATIGLAATIVRLFSKWLPSPAISVAGIEGCLQKWEEGFERDG